MMMMIPGLASNFIWGRKLATKKVVMMEENREREKFEKEDRSEREIEKIEEK